MRPRVCLFVPFLVLGCYDSHARGRDGGPPGRDAGPLGRDTGGMVDFYCECCVGVSRPADGVWQCPSLCAGLCPDAGICGPREIELLCYDHVRVGVPTTVEVTYAPDGECFCDQDITCTASIVEPGRLALTTELCPETPLCRACGGPPSGTCALPALPTPGAWRVEVNGRATMEIDVVPADVLPERADVCDFWAPPGGCGDYTPEPFEVGRACHDTWAAPDTRVPIRVTEACGGCQSIGPCEVTVVDGTIHVAPTRMRGVCGFDCPPVCMPTEHVCWTPPLVPGRYAVAVDGLAIDEPTVIEVSDGGAPIETCIGD